MRVLVVEDTPKFANRIAQGLRNHQIAVDIAYDGLEAASKLHINPYDVVLLDRDLPGIHGDELCRIITSSENPAMILMLTAAGTPEDRVYGLALGADDYLPKPFHFPELVLRDPRAGPPQTHGSTPHAESRWDHARSPDRHCHPQRTEHRARPP